MLMQRTKNKVLDCLKEHKGYMCQSDITKKSGVHLYAVQEATRQLVEESQVEKIAFGKVRGFRFIKSRKEKKLQPGKDHSNKGPTSTRN